MTERKLIRLEDFPSTTYDKLRYSDADRQGHLNNAVFATFIETGRVDLFEKITAICGHRDGLSVVVRLAIDFLAEVHTPGTVEIGTMIDAIGRSSVTFGHALFQHGKCVATAQSVAVHLDATTRRPLALDDNLRAAFASFMQAP